MSSVPTAVSWWCAWPGPPLERTEQTEGSVSCVTTSTTTDTGAAAAAELPPCSLRRIDLVMRLHKHGVLTRAAND